MYLSKLSVVRQFLHFNLFQVLKDNHRISQQAIRNNGRILKASAEYQCPKLATRSLGDDELDPGFKRYYYQKELIAE
jgi:hypothetical protein